eukprot:UN23873
MAPLNSFLWYCDINAAPKKKFLEVCALYAQDPNEKETLLKMSTQNLKQSPEFWTILTLLQAFQSVKIP